MTLIVCEKVRSHVWSFERKTYTWSSRKSSHSMKSGGFHEIRMKSGGFHPWNPYEIHRISPVKSVWNLVDFTHEIRMKSTRFHEICMKSVWNPPDFMKSVWNPADFERQLPGMVSPMFCICWITVYWEILQSAAIGKILDNVFGSLLGSLLLMICSMNLKLIKIN